MASTYSRDISAPDSCPCTTAAAAVYVSCVRKSSVRNIVQNHRVEASAAHSLPKPGQLHQSSPGPCFLRSSHAGPQACKYGRTRPAVYSKHVTPSPLIALSHRHAQRCRRPVTAGACGRILEPSTRSQQPRVVGAAALAFVVHKVEGRLASLLCKIQNRH